MPRFVMPSNEQFLLVNGEDRIEFVVGGNPAPQKRAGRTPHGRAYNGSRVLEEEFAATARQQFEGMGLVVPWFGIDDCIENVSHFSLPNLRQHY